MSSESTKIKKCANCGIFSNKIPGPKKIVDTLSDAASYSEFFNRDISIGSYVCKNCRTDYSFEQSKLRKTEALQNLPSTAGAQTESEKSESQQSSGTTVSFSQSSGSVYECNIVEKQDIEYVELPFRRPVSTHKRCFICRENRAKLVQVPFEARQQVFMKERTFIPKGNRCCGKHLLKKRIYEDEIQNIIIVSNTSNVQVDEVAKMLNFLSVSCDRELTDRIGDFTLSDERIFTFTGLTWEQIIELKEMMPSVRNSESRSVTQALVVFLFRMRTGNSNNLISSVLGLDRPQQVSDYSDSILNAFEHDILPYKFGIHAMKRQQLIENTAPIAKELHNLSDDELGLVCDATYLYHQKSTNNDYQRRSYSGQKKKPLTKPFTICTTNGLIVDIMGPYFANQNDAQIMQQIIEDPNGLVTLLKDGDAFFVDRGFRDVQALLEEKKYKVYMPALKGKRNQLNTEESNRSRKVTLVRWVVEAIHGIIGMKYKLFHQQFDNKMIPKAHIYC